jgi:PAS domain S-box-containing protein
VAGQPVSEHIQALVYTSVNDVIFHLRVEGQRYRFLQVNPAFTRSTGLAPDKVVGKYVDAVIPEASLSLVLGKYRQAIEERRTVRWEEVTEYPSGTKVGEVSVTPVFEADRCTQLVGTVTDVTETRAQRKTIQLYADLVQSVQMGISVWKVSDLDDVGSIRLVAYNPEAERQVNIDLSTAVGKGILEILPGLGESKLPALIAAVARDKVVLDEPEIRSVMDRARVMSVKAFPLAEGMVGLAIDDVSVRVRAAHLQAGERRALEMLASGAPTGEILRVIVETIEELEPGTVASILLLDETGAKLRHGSAPRLPDEYNRAIDGSAVSEKAGSCGTAAFLGRPVYVVDILTDPLWDDYRDLARMTGMRACWSTPIRSNDGSVLGTFALYHRTRKMPDGLVLDTIGRATHVAGIVLERRRLDEELRALTARIEAVREEERTGMARELHDELGQTLTALKMDIAWIGRRANANRELDGKLAEMSRMTDGMIQEIRRISAELRPVVLDDLGLAAALEWYASEFGERIGIPCNVRVDLGDAILERDLSTAAFRIYQEALTNVARHAAASCVDITLRMDASNLRLEIADDGVGLPQSTKRPGSLGLVGMRERARRLGGECVVSRREPKGTIVTLLVPIRKPASACLES